MEIPSRYSPKEVEAKILEKWLSSNYFQAKPCTDKIPFTIVIPPPNITGILHMGHALNNTIQDVLIRFKRMQGYVALWMPGTDHAGIATQNVVERELVKENLKKEALGREELLKRLWAWKNKYGSTIIEQLKRLGASCDWSRIRFTMDEEYSFAVKEAFIRLYEKGLIYRGNYIINFCPRCKTALSDEEAPHREIEGWLYYIRYPVITHNAQRKAQSEYVVVATTRPETMLGDTAVAIHPDDERYKWLKDAAVTLPIMERPLRVIEDDTVDPKFGTGLVKVTPAHDPLDFILGKKHNLDFINIMEDNATLNENAGDFVGMDRFEAREAILEVLKEKKLIEKKEPYKISAGHCYRCSTLIEPRLSLQWFVKMKPLAERAIGAVENDTIRFYPARWKKVYLNWMYNIQDWCISRQIWWGHRLPVYYCKNCYRLQAAGFKLQAAGFKLQAAADKGIIVSRLKPEKCSDCGSTDIYQDEDVLDTWFSSWLWPFATFYWPKINYKPKNLKPEALSLKPNDLEYFYPTSVLVTASEILFFWVARMIMAGLEFMHQIPFKDVFIHGTVRDIRGIKMSKSLGNIIDPLEIIDKFGADSLRFSLMLSCSTGSSVYLSDEKFLVGRNFSNKLWNATRFLFLKLKDANLNLTELDLKNLDVIDTWILKELNTTIENTSRHLEQYRIDSAAKAIYDFLWHSFCDWYIELIKDNFTEGKAKVSFYTLKSAIKLLHPIMPFITEEIFQMMREEMDMPKDESIVISPWPKQIELAPDDKLPLLEKVFKTLKEVRTIKVDLGIAKEKIRLMLATSDTCKEFWRENNSWILRLASLESIEYTSEVKRALYRNELWELGLVLPDIELKNFVASLNKKIENLEAICTRIAQRLASENFLNNAPQGIVEEERERYDDLNSELRRLRGLRDALQ